MGREVGDDVTRGGIPISPSTYERFLRRFRFRVAAGAATRAGAGKFKPHIEKQVRFECSPHKHREGGYSKGDGGKTVGIVRSTFGRETAGEQQAILSRAKLFPQRKRSKG